MAKYFYVYNIAGVEDSIVKMFNTDTGAMGEKSVKKDRMDGFIDGIKTSGFVLNIDIDVDSVKEYQKDKAECAVIDIVEEMQYVLNKYQRNLIF